MNAGHVPFHSTLQVVKAPVAPQLWLVIGDDVVVKHLGHLAEGVGLDPIEHPGVLSIEVLHHGFEVVLIVEHEVLGGAVAGGWWVVLHLVVRKDHAKLSRHPVALGGALGGLQEARGPGLLVGQVRGLGLVGQRGDGLLSRLLEFVQDAESKVHFLFRV